MEVLENASQAQAFPSASPDYDPILTSPGRRVPDLNMAPSSSPQGSPYAAGHDGVRSSSQGHILLATFPYMMAGLAAMILVLLLSLVLLICCYLRILSNAAGSSRLQARQSGHEVTTADASAWNSWNSQARSHAQAQASMAQGTTNKPEQDDGWSKVVVIMAGDVTPSFLALPCDFTQRTADAATSQQSNGLT